MTDNLIESNERRWFTMIPNIVDDMDLDPYAFRLYVHLRRVAGETGACWQSTATLSDHCKMSEGSVSKAKTALNNKGLIQVEFRTRNATRYHHITILDIWIKNMKAFTRSPGECVNSPSERVPSPGETKKNPIKKNPLHDAIGEKDYLEAVVDFAKTMDKNDDRPKGWRDASDGEYRICERVALLWAGGRLPWAVDDIEKQLAAAYQLLLLFDGDEREALWTIDEFHTQKGDDLGFMVNGPYSLRNAIPLFLEEKKKGSKGQHSGDGVTIRDGKKVMKVGM